jgi:hypothetical protein
MVDKYIISWRASAHLLGRKLLHNMHLPNHMHLCFLTFIKDTKVSLVQAGAVCYVLQWTTNSRQLEPLMRYCLHIGLLLFSLWDSFVCLQPVLDFMLLSIVDTHNSQYLHVSWEQFESTFNWYTFLVSGWAVQWWSDINGWNSFK